MVHWVTRVNMDLLGKLGIKVKRESWDHLASLDLQDLQVVLVNPDLRVHLERKVMEEILVHQVAMVTMVNMEITE
jgi:hypothetical protein